MRRFLSITGTLGLLGALAGACGGMLGVVLGLALERIPHGGANPEVPSLVWILEVAAAIGAVVGGLASPALTWTFLRRVPIWRAGCETAFAAAFGFVAALGLIGDRYGIVPLFAIAFAFLSLAAGRLIYVYRPTTSPTRTRDAV